MRRLVVLITLCLSNFAYQPLFAEEDYEDEETIIEESEIVPRPSTPTRRPKRVLTKRKYFTDTSPRSDAGIFHVGFAVGGNIYMEPKLRASDNEFADDYFKDFGYQGGVYFDYDYSRASENIPLALRGFLGYKYALNSTHIFAAEGVVRRIFNLSENSDFGLGAGVSLATWFRNITQISSTETVEIEQTVLLPTFILSAGFDFNPFMVDLKWMIHRFGVGESLMGAEFYFGVRF